MPNRRELILGTAAFGSLLSRPLLLAAQSANTDELTALTLHEAAAQVRTGAVSPLELTKACLARIERYDTKINAFITVTAELALAQARTAEQEILRGHWRGPLHGIPIALKDNIDTAGIRTTAASDVFRDRIPAEDAEVVARLRRAGAVILGKLNMWEFAMSPESDWGPVHNPWALEYECGYSSSGAGAAVAAHFCFGALGTDTSGSVRLPASACGVVGLKPTYGLVSNRGVIPLVESLDHVGPLARCVLDTALLLQGIAGHDSSWTHSANVQLSDYATALGGHKKSFGLGIPRAGCFEKLDPQVEQIVQAALETMRTIGAIRSERIVIPEAAIPHEGKVAQVRASLFEKAWLARDMFTDGVDLLVLPTWKRLPMTIAERRKNWPPKMQELWNTHPFNVLGLPALSLPCGYTKSGLPVGVQIVGRPFAETQVLAFAHAYEQATAWRTRKPVL